MTDGERRRPRRVPPAIRRAEAARDAERARVPAGAPKQRFRLSFPVVFAFSLGVFAMGMLNYVPVVSVALFALGIAGTGYGTARIIVRWLAARRSR